MTAFYQVHKKYSDYIENCEKTTGDVITSNIHQVAIQSLAELTARIVGHFHRCGQLMLINPQGPVTVYKDKAISMAK